VSGRRERDANAWLRATSGGTAALRQLTHSFEHMEHIGRRRERIEVDQGARSVSLESFERLPPQLGSSSSTHASSGLASISLVCPEPRIIGAQIDYHRKRPVWVQTSHGTVQRSLGPHASRTPDPKIACLSDVFAIADHNHLHRVICIVDWSSLLDGKDGVCYNLVHLSKVPRVDVKRLPSSGQISELCARGVESLPLQKLGELLHIVTEQGVEQRRGEVVEVAENTMDCNHIAAALSDALHHVFDLLRAGEATVQCVRRLTSTRRVRARTQSESAIYHYYRIESGLSPVREAQSISDIVTHTAWHWAELLPR